MIGVILSGHGRFASGLLSAVQAIAGKQNNAVAVDFLARDSGESLRIKLQQAVEEMPCDAIAIFTDISGGTPFQQSVLISCDADRPCRVFSGTNLPLLLKFLMERALYPLDVLTEKALHCDQVKASAYQRKEKASVISTDEL